MLCLFYWQQEANIFGIDWEQSVIDITETVSVDIPKTGCPITSEDFEELLMELPPAPTMALTCMKRVLNFVCLSERCCLFTTEFTTEFISDFNRLLSCSGCLLFINFISCMCVTEIERTLTSRSSFTHHH